MNKNGWGLRFELFFIFIFLFCLLIATIGLNKLELLSDKDEYDAFGNLIDDSLYRNYEEEIRKAALSYYKNNYSNSVTDTVYISTNKLQLNGYISEMKEDNDKLCTGYAKVSSNSNVAAYIKCSKYTTVGYDSNYE